MARTKNTRARDCAPDIEDANRLKVAAGGDIINVFIIACAMYLAMDKGMILHWRKGWVRPWEGKIYIPDKQICDIGPGGKACSYCKKHGLGRRSVKEFDMNGFDLIKMTIEEERMHAISDSSNGLGWVHCIHKKLSVTAMTLIGERVKITTDRR